MKTIVAALFLLAGNLCGQVPTVSLIQLIATPEKFDGKVVRFDGVTNLEFEGNAIYISKEHQKHGITSFGIWLDVTPELEKSRKWANGKYCILEGTFNAKERGHGGLFMESLSGITMFHLREAVSPDEAARLQKEVVAGATTE